MRFFFHLVDAHGAIRDKDGVDVADIDELRVEAEKAIAELRLADPSAAHEWKGWRLDVSDASGAVLLTLNLDPVSP